MRFNIISQFHPAAALHNPRLWAVMLDDWEHMPEKVPCDFILVGALPEGCPVVALDTENDPSGKLGDWSIATRNEAGELIVAPFFGAQPKFETDAQVVMHNAKWDLNVLRNNGMKEPRNIQDTMIAAYCMGLGRQDVKDSTKGKSGDRMVGGLGLKYLARRHLGIQMKTWLEVKDKPELVPEYNAMDSIATYLLFEKWAPQLPQHYWDIDMPLLRVLMAMEARGIMIDPAYLKDFANGLDKELAQFDLPLNPFSPDQIRSYVYGELGIEPWKFTDTGAPSTDSDVLENIDDPTIKGILKYKELYQERETYAENYLKGIDAENRIHTEFKQTSTATGRLSCARPNLQNVVKEGNMRKLFVAAEGKKLIRLDWKLVEFGMLAVLAEDTKLIKAFLTGDVHRETAEALGVDRGTGKHINFLMQNGGTAWGMSQEYGIPIGQARKYFDGYFERFPAIKRYHDKVVAEAKATKKVVGHWGRTRRLDALFANDWRVRQEGEKEAKTMPMQNGAAELVKLAMIDLHYKHHAPMTLQVHDELLFEVDDKDAKEYAHWLLEYVPTITEVKGIRFPVEVGIGNNWKEAGG